MSALDKLAEGHVQSQALRAVRVAQGDRAVAVDHLSVMAAHDPTLAQGLLALGIGKAVKDAKGAFDGMVRTGGAFVACHPED